MSLASRLTRLPRPYDPGEGAVTRDRVPDLDGPLGDLVEGAAGCSPFLKSLVESEGDWLAGAVADPEGALAAIHDAHCARCPTTGSGQSCAAPSGAWRC